MPINYHEKFFRSVENSPNGEVSGETIFHYREGAGPGAGTQAAAASSPTVVWATYRGGSVVWGTLTGTKSPEGNLSFCYQHVNTDGALRTGCCDSRPTILDSGLIELSETWRWTNGDESSGTSVVREFIPTRAEVEGL